MAQLPIRKKLYYAMGGLSMNLCDMVFLQWLFVRYCPDNRPHLVPPVVLGLCILIDRIIESVAGPLIGHWSDGFKSPMGRRLPFVRRGLVPLAVCFFLLWCPPEGAGQLINTGYALVMVLAYLIMYNLTITPYLGLLPEITSDLKERVNITTLQAVFIMGSLLTFSAIGNIIEKGGWLLAALLVSTLTILFMMPTIFGIRETYIQPEKDERLPFLRELWLALENPAFFYIVIATSFYWLALNSILMLMPFWVMNFLHLSKDYVTWLMLPFLIMNTLSFFVFNYLANRYGKYIVFLLSLPVSGVFFAMLAAVGLFSLGSNFFQTMIVVALIGAAVAGFTVLPFAMLSDAVDYDEKLTGRRREAIFFGFQGTFQKIGLGLSSLIFGLVSPYSLKMVAVLAAIVSFIAFFVFIKYPLRDYGGKITIKGRRTSEI